MRTALVLLPLLALFVPARTASAGYEPGDPDSLNVIFGIDLIKEKLEELSGAGISEFHLYTASDRSKVAWWRDGKLYLYDVSGDQHDRRAAALVERLQHGALASFVVPRRASARHGSTEAFDVRAIQVLTAMRPPPEGRAPDPRR